MAESYKAARQNSPEALKGVDIFFFVADFGRTQRSFQQVYIFGGRTMNERRAIYVALRSRSVAIFDASTPPRCCM